VHGLFITGNSIQSREYCIEAQDNGLATIHIADNYIYDSKMGVYMNKSYSDVHVHNNYFKNITDTPIKLLSAYEIYVAKNVIEDSNKSLHITGAKGSFVIENNAYAKKATIDIENFTYKEPAKQVNIYVVLSIVFSIAIIALIVVLVFLLKKKA
jgi:pectate lyase